MGAGLEHVRACFRILPLSQKEKGAAVECGCGAVLWVLVVSGRTCVRAWQLAEEHGLALERQAESTTAWKKRRNASRGSFRRKLRSAASGESGARGRGINVQMSVAATGKHRQPLNPSSHRQAQATTQP